MSFTPAPDPLTASRWRDVYVTAAAAGISVCGDFLAATALTLSLQSAGAGGYAVSALMLASTVPLFALAPLAGRLADRFDSRALLVLAGLGQAAVCAVLAFATRPFAAIALVALLASGLALTQPTVAALLPAMVRREDLPRTAALNQTARYVGMLLGPALAGLLVGEFGVRVPLLLDAASYLALVGAGLALRTRRGGRTIPQAALADSVARPAWSLWRDPILRAMVISIAAVVGAVGTINIVEVFFVRETLGASATMYGVLSAAWTAGMLVGVWALARAARRIHDDGGLTCGVLLMLGGVCAALPVAATAGSAGWLVPLWLVGGGLNGGMNVFSNVLMANRVPEARRGRAFATLNGSVQGAGMAGFLAGGLLIEHVPARTLVAGLGVTGLLAVAAVTPPVLRAVRRERAGTSPRPAAILELSGADA